VPFGEEWAVRYERQGSPSMDNASGVTTQTMSVRDEVIARSAVKNRAPIGVTNRRAVSRPAFEWREASVDE
jgi:hypothetical protein